jgi:outer membrane protein assembly factor BamB
MVRGLERVSIALVSAAALVGCGGLDGPGPKARLAGRAGGEQALAAPTPPPVCRQEATVATPLTVARGAAVDHLLAGRYRDAVRALEATIGKYPRDLVSLYLHNAAAAGVVRNNAEARRSLRAPWSMEPIPPGQETRSPLAVAAPALPPLRKVDERSNLFVDDVTWLRQHGLEAPTFRMAGVGAPEVVPRSVEGRPLELVLSHPDHDLGAYGSIVGVFAPRTASRLFDFTDAVSKGGLAIGHMRAAGSALLVQLTSDRHRADVGGRTGYLLAVSLEDGRLLWSSGPLVANAENFAVVGGSVVTGFGFSRQGGRLYVLDLATGRTRQKISLSSAARWILPNGNKLFVRTLDKDYQLGLGGSVEPAPAADLGRAGDAGVADREVRCWVDAAVASVEARDVDALRGALEALDRHHADEVVVTAVAAAAQFIEQLQSPSRRVVDVWRGEEVVAGAPPWTYTRNVPAAAPDRPPRLVPRLLLMSERRAKPNGSFIIGGPRVVARRLQRTFPIAAPADYGLEPLEAVFPAGDGHLLLYGGRRVVVVDARGDAVRAYDLEQLRHPPRVDPRLAQWALQDVTGVALVGEVLYVANGGGLSASDSFGKRGFVTALDARTGKLLWRSEPLVTGTTLVALGDYLITGYGFLGDPSHLFLLRRADGSIARRVPLESPPVDIYIEDGFLRVDANGGAFDFDVRP